jgi:hypothetical protein
MTLNNGQFVMHTSVFKRGNYVPLFTGKAKKLAKNLKDELILNLKAKHYITNTIL